jgi:uncharacterized membrane-anchored protein
MKKLSLIIFFIFFSSHLSAINLEMPVNDDDFANKINTLNWNSGPKKIPFTEAKATINISGNYEYLEGEDVNQFLYWLNGVEFPLQKVLVMPKGEDWGSYYYVYSYSDSGYVKIDDWNDVDPDEFLKDLEKGYKADNAERRKKNQATLTSVSWRYSPKLNRNKNLVNYAVVSKWSDNDQSVQASSLILGREGYTEATMITSAAGYKDSLLENASAIHEFNPDVGYNAWKPGDKVAAIGIAGLLAATLGGKSAKVAAPILVVLLGLLKKFWWIVILPFLWLGKLFSRSSSSSESETSENVPEAAPKKRTRTKKK